jgi:hypothetical protein
MKMKFAKWVFLIAGVYGIIVVAPMYFSESRISRDFPPAITHPEFFYGFIGVTLAWQVVFLILSRDPIKYRLLILPAILEKASYGIAVILLFMQQRVGNFILAGAVVDLVLGALFVATFMRTRQAAK